MISKLRTILITALLASLLPGCSKLEVKSVPDLEKFAADPRLQQPAKLPDVSVAILKTGEITSLDALFVNGGSWTQKRTGVHSAILVRHPQGNLLFDSGLGNHIDEQFQAALPFWLKPLMKYKKLQSAQAQLAGVNPPLKINRIIMSHLHWDHAGGIKDFPDAEIWTTETEYQHAIDPHTPERSFFKSQLDGKQVKWHFLNFDDVPYENFSRSLDLFKDGSIVLVPLPGHTPGSLGMFVNLRSGKRLFFTGDTTWTLEGLTRPAEKFWFSRWVVDDDRQAVIGAILQVHRLMQQYPELVVVPAHDAAVQQKIGFYPSYTQ